MSATARATATRPARRPSTSPGATAASTRRSPRSTLREVPAPTPSVAGPGMFSLVVLGVLVGGAMLLLVLNTSLAQGAFELSELSKEQRDLAVSEQALLQDVAKAESPESLQRRAERLGMVPVASPVFLRLADGKVLGVPKAAKADPTARRVPVTGAAAAGTTTGTTATSTTTTSATTTTTTPATTTDGAAQADAAVADPAPVDDAALPDAAAPDAGASTGARP